MNNIQKCFRTSCILPNIFLNVQHLSSYVVHLILQYFIGRPSGILKLEFNMTCLEVHGFCFVLWFTITDV